MARFVNPRLSKPGSRVVILTDSTTKTPFSFYVAEDATGPGHTVYSLRALMADDECISDETWVKCRDLAAPAASTLNPRVDNAAPAIPAPDPVLDINIDDVIAEAPAPVAPPEAPKAKRGK